MEKKLLNWFNIYHKKGGHKVTTKEFKEKAKFFSEDTTFKASKGWLQKFRKRNDIKLNKKKDQESNFCLRRKSFSKKINIT